MLAKSVIDKPTSRILIFHRVPSADISLVSQKDHNRRALTIRCVRHYFRRNFTVSHRILGQNRGTRGDTKPGEPKKDSGRTKSKPNQHSQTKETVPRGNFSFHN